MIIDRLSDRVEKLELKTKAKKRTPVPFFFQRADESEEDFNRRVDEGTKDDDWTPESGRVRCLICRMNKPEPPP